MKTGFGVGTTNREDMAHQEKNHSKQSWKEMRSHCFKIEVAVVFCLILVVWGLLSLPIIFYYIPVEEVRLQSF